MESLPTMRTIPCRFPCFFGPLLLDSPEDHSSIRAAGSTTLFGSPPAAVRPRRNWLRVGGLRRALRTQEPKEILHRNGLRKTQASDTVSNTWTRWGQRCCQRKQESPLRRRTAFVAWDSAWRRETSEGTCTVSRACGYSLMVSWRRIRLR